jgi:hypothetical protein
MLIFLLAALVASDSLPPPVRDTAVVVAVSPRIGDQIDAKERRMFHMFPGVENFNSAAFFRMPDGTYFLAITTDSTQTRQYPVTPEQFGRITNYVDHFEELVGELGALPNGHTTYLDLWQGIGRSAKDTGATPAGPPPHAGWTSQVVDGLTGAACGLGVGGTIGAMSAIKFVESRQESLLVHDCFELGSHWYHYSVDVYDVNRGTYAGAAGAGLAAGTGTGLMLGTSQARRSRVIATPRKGVAGYDLFGDPITDYEVRQRMQAPNRILCTFLGISTGWVVGASAGLLAVAIARGVVFHPNTWDTIIIRHDGFTFDLPLIAFALGGTLRGAYVGYSLGERQDWREAVEDLKRERLAVRP